MKLAEMKQLSPAEITEQVKKSRLELVDLRMKFASRQLDNPSELKKKRKEIARLLTIHTVKPLNVSKEVKNVKISNAKKPKLTKGKKDA